MKSKLLNNKVGFTLLEVIIAMVILTVGLIGTAGLLISVIRTNDLSNEMSKANTLAKTTMEVIRQQGYLGAVSAPETSVNFADSTFKRQVDVSSTGTNGAKAVKVTITYASFGPHTVEMNTIIAR